MSTLNFGVDKPTVDLVVRQGGMFVPPNTGRILDCSVIGFPVPEVTWFTQKCTDAGCVARDELWEKITENNLAEKLVNQASVSIAKCVLK